MKQNFHLVVDFVGLGRGPPNWCRCLLAFLSLVDQKGAKCAQGVTWYLHLSIAQKYPGSDTNFDFFLKIPIIIKKSGTCGSWRLKSYSLTTACQMVTKLATNIYQPQRSWAKVMFLQVSVILLTGGVCLSTCWDTTPLGADLLGADPPRADTPQEQTPPPESKRPPGSRPPGADTPLGADTTPPGSRHPPGSRLRDTVNERPVRILL